MGFFSNFFFFKISNSENEFGRQCVVIQHPPVVWGLVWENWGAPVRGLHLPSRSLQRGGEGASRGKGGAVRPLEVSSLLSLLTIGTVGQIVGQFVGFIESLCFVPGDKVISLRVSAVADYADQSGFLRFLHFTPPFASWGNTGGRFF